MQKRPAYVGLGGNVASPWGDVRATLDAATRALALLPGVVALRRSSLWETRPVGDVTDQAWFLNAAVELVLAGPPSRERALSLLASLLELERAAGRDRGSAPPGGPRPLDLDLLAWDALVLDEPGPPRLVLPHPRAHERVFVLAPLDELTAGALVLPGRGSVRALLAEAGRDPSQAVRKIV